MYIKNKFCKFHILLYILNYLGASGVIMSAITYTTEEVLSYLE